MIKQAYFLILPLLASISIQSADESKSDGISGLNIREAGLIASSRLSGPKQKQLEELIDRNRWNQVIKWLPKDLKDEYNKQQEYLKRTIKHPVEKTHDDSD